jgi:hypothetical protein
MIIIMNIGNIKTIFYNVPNAWMELKEMTMQFMTPPRIVLPIKVRRLA